MQKLRYSLRFVLLAAVLAVTACAGKSKKAEKETLEQASMIEVSIGGMTCTGCEQTIQKNVMKLDGIKSVKASFTTGKAEIEYYTGKVDTLQMKEAISGAGYTVNRFTALNP